MTSSEQPSLSDVWQNFEDDVLRVETLIQAGLLHEAALIARGLAGRVGELADGPLADDVRKLLLAVADC